MFIKKTPLPVDGPGNSFAERWVGKGGRSRSVFARVLAVRRQQLQRRAHNNGHGDRQRQGDRRSMIFEGFKGDV